MSSWSNDNAAAMNYNRCMFGNLFHQYRDVLPLIGVSAVVAAVLAPVFGRLARATGFVDKPRAERDTRERGRETRIHDRPTPKLGGLAVILPMLVFGGMVAVVTDVFSLTQLVCLAVGLVIVLVYTIVDIRKNLSGTAQIAIQVGAALVVVMGGTRFTEIGLIGLKLDQLRLALPAGLSLVLPADVLNIVWIVVLTNAINWVFSVDAAGESIVLLTAIGLVLANMKLGNMGVALMCAVLVGAMLGYLPYNLPRARMFSGTDVFYGFLLAVLSIVSSGKLLTAASMLAFPLVDMAWVLVARVRTHRTLDPRRLLQISDTTHLAHRLRSLGLSAWGILAVESGIAVFSVIMALAVLQFNRASLALVPAVVVAGVFVVVELVRVRRARSARVDAQVPPR